MAIKTTDFLRVVACIIEWWRCQWEEGCTQCVGDGEQREVQTFQATIQMSKDSFNREWHKYLLPGAGRRILLLPIVPLVTQHIHAQTIRKSHQGEGPFEGAEPIGVALPR